MSMLSFYATQFHEIYTASHRANSLNTIHTHNLVLHLRRDVGRDATTLPQPKAELLTKRVNSLDRKLWQTLRQRVGYHRAVLLQPVPDDVGGFAWVYEEPSWQGGMGNHGFCHFRVNETGEDGADFHVVRDGHGPQVHAEEFEVALC